MARVSSQKSSFQHLYDAPLQRRTSPIDDDITSHVCGFCVTLLGVWSSSRSAHQATLQSFPAGMFGATQIHAQVGPPSCAVIITETAIRISRWCWRESSDDVIPLKWWTMKCVFLLALALARRRSYLHALSVAPDRCVFPRGNTQRQLVVSLLPESAGVCALESQHQRYHEESHKLMDRGDCQGSLHSSWSRVWPSYCTWGQSAVSFLGVQLSGGITWQPVSGVLEVIWGLPEFVAKWHGLHCWGHVYIGSSGGRTSGASRTSSPSSIAYTICMQPLLRLS